MKLFGRDALAVAGIGVCAAVSIGLTAALLGGSEQGHAECTTELETVVSEVLRDAAELYFEAGDHEQLVKLSGDDFNRLFADARYLPCSIHKA